MGHVAVQPERCDLSGLFYSVFKKRDTRYGLIGSPDCNNYQKVKAFTDNITSHTCQRASPIDFILKYVQVIAITPKKEESALHQIDAVFKIMVAQLQLCWQGICAVVKVHRVRMTAMPGLRTKCSSTG